MLSADNDRNDRVPMTFNVVARQSAEGAFGVSPQHLQRVAFSTRARRGKCIHLSDSIVESTLFFVMLFALRARDS
jgi:hypothetical protein